MSGIEPPTPPSGSAALQIRRRIEDQRRRRDERARVQDVGVQDVEVEEKEASPTRRARLVDMRA